MRANRIAYLGIFTALAMILGYIESLFPFLGGIPGVKIGIANSISLSVLYLMGYQAAFLTAVIRIVLTGILFGNVASVLYSLGGALLSLTVMILVKKTDIFSIVGTSIAGGISHNIAQLLIAMLLVENLSVLYYLPVLLISGAMAGVVVGVVSQEVVKRIPAKILDESGINSLEESCK
ncbi:MAG: Gx transporter family protein [Lachnospiraceae bacterium]|mgnify:CR=1 FL=1|jgi:heptaprenyl diphosphate synthase|nr:Gx transporter family protein [Lachnospiraceae bacterium]RKJ50117.1 Gx transporter family protein [bacterium 1XD42-54]